MAKGESVHEESDALHRAAVAALYKKQKEAAEVKDALSKDPELMQKVKDYIFSGDPDAESPLEFIRKKYRD